MAAAATDAFGEAEASFRAAKKKFLGWILHTQKHKIYIGSNNLHMFIYKQFDYCNSSQPKFNILETRAKLVQALSINKK